MFTGKSFGCEGEVVGEIVFTTAMTGYEETLTDPSYCGQIVTQTFPLIGNYGVNDESKTSVVSGYIVREYCEVPSNFRCEGDIDGFLKKHNIIGLFGIDTRRLTRIIRETGVMNGMITTSEPTDEFKAQALEKIRAYVVGPVVPKVSVKQPEKSSAENGKYKVALMDYGYKFNIRRELVKRGCDVTVFPYDTSAEEILKFAPGGIMRSSGPGDPQDNTVSINTLKELIPHKIPTFGICLGHQLLALANGATTVKLKYGHRGGNHPVKDLETGRVYISSQNHGYVVDAEGLEEKNIAHPAFVNVNDGTNEGMAYNGKNIFTVQFHPEACPGPQDSSYLFDRFMKMMGGEK